MRLVSLLILGLCFQSYAQITRPDSTVNPVKAMFVQRYLPLQNIPLSINYQTNQIFSSLASDTNKIAQKNGWILTFEDNFDSVDRNKWRLGQPWGYFHGGFLHQYHEENNVSCRDGYLYLRGEYNPKTFPYKDSSVTIPYSIGLINSDISFSQKYGYFEIKCMNPKGPATWPAFWLAGAHHWPPEIDIFEMYGKSDGKQIHKQISSIHYGQQGQKSRGTIIRRFWMPRDTDTTFHIYACEWSPKFIKFYSDGILIRKQRINKRLRRWLDDEMVIIINNGFEAKYLKYLPKDFKGNALVVDWVRVYRKI